MRPKSVGSFLTTCEHIPLTGAVVYWMFLHLPERFASGATCWICERKYGRDWFSKTRSREGSNEK